MQGTGCVVVVCGSMYAGKSDELIRQLRRSIQGKRKVVAFKPTLDVRGAGEAITTHDGRSFPARRVAHANEIESLVGDAEVVGIDEAQFFTDEIVDVVQRLAAQGKRVIVAGLDTDFRGLPFGPMGMLLAIADDVNKVHAVCTVCSAPAVRTQRITDSREIVLIGSKSSYDARCRIHWSPEPVFTARENHDEYEG